MKKRGISTIVATVLIVLVTVVSVGILWAGFRPLIDRVMFIESMDVMFKVDKSSYTYYDEENDLLSVRVTRGADDEDVTAIKLIINDGGDSYSYVSSDVMSPNSAKVYHFDVGRYNSIDEVSVVPIYNVNGQRVESQHVNGIEKVPKKDLSIEVTNPVDFGSVVTGGDLLEDLVVYFSFSDSYNGDTQVRDSSGNGVVGGLTGDAIVDDGALVLDGAGDYVEVDDGIYNVDVVGDEITIIYWEKWVNNIHDNPVVSKSGTASDPEGAYITGHVGLLHYFKIDNTDPISSSALGDFAAGPWRNLAFVYKSGELSHTYLDGFSVADYTNTGTLAGNSENLKIGVSNLGGGYFKGKIDDVMIFDRALTEDEIIEIYGMGRSE